MLRGSTRPWSPVRVHLGRVAGLGLLVGAAALPLGTGGALASGPRTPPRAHGVLARPHTGAVPVLGAKSYMLPFGEGWGTVAPSYLFNGGSPSGSTRNIVWRSWGSSRSRGTGESPYNLPQGGYSGYVAVRLRAQDLGSCRPGGKLAYRVLWAREEQWPGGPMSAWYHWAGDSNVCHRDGLG